MQAVAAEVLGKPVTMDDNLLECGMNSILATHFMWQAGQHGCVFYLFQLFRFPTIRSLVNSTIPHCDDNDEEEVLSDSSKITLTDAEKSLYLLLFVCFVVLLTYKDIFCRLWTNLHLPTMRLSCYSILEI